MERADGGPAIDSLLVEHIMRACERPAMTIHAAARLMTDHDVSGVLHEAPPRTSSHAATPRAPATRTTTGSGTLNRQSTTRPTIAISPVGTS
jgi:hypothetical protein